MTSHSYYKDRLGFDPNDDMYSETNINSTVKKTTRHHNSNHVGHHHHHHHHHQHQHHATSGSPSRISISPASNHTTFTDFYAETSPAKRAKHSTAQQQPQGGYEDALTQFKGSMSIWEYFIENWDIVRKSAVESFIHLFVNVDVFLRSLFEITNALLFYMKSLMIQILDCIWSLGM